MYSLKSGMFNWIKKGIVTAGIIFGMGLTSHSQSMSSIIEQIHKEDNTTQTYTIDEAISEALENNITIRQRMRNIEKDTLYFEIERNNRRRTDVNGNASMGYNIKEGITNFNDTKLYPEFSMTFSIPILNTDTKYQLQIRVNEIKKEHVRLLYDVSRVIEATGTNYVNIIHIDKMLESYKKEKEYIRDKLTTQKDSTRLEIVQEEFISLIREIDKQQLELEQNREDEINQLTSRFGKISRGKLLFNDSLQLPQKNLFKRPTYDHENINAYLDTLAAASVIIRTQIERINIENAVITYMKKTNFEITGSTSLNLRNTVVPTPYLGAPINAGIRFNIFGNNVKQEKRIAELNILNQEDNITAVINSIVPSVQRSMKNMLLSMSLATEGNKEIYLGQLEDMEKIYSDTIPVHNGEQVKLSKYAETIKKHYNAQREYYTHVANAMKQEYNVRSHVLFQENPYEFAHALEQQMKTYNLHSGKERREARKNLREIRIPEIKSIFRNR